MLTLSPRYFVYLTALIGALGGLLFGYDTGVIAGAMIFIDQSFSIGTFTQEMVVSSVVLGALIGAILSGRLADYYGRRAMLISAAVMFIIGTTITFSVNHVDWLIGGRFIIGIAIGVSSYTTPLFISEMAPTRLRGSLVLLNAITITGGEALAFLVDYALAPTQSWRLMFASGLVPALFLLIGMLFLPETPRWLVLKGYTEHAKRVLSKIRRQMDINKELEDISTSFSLSLKNPDWRELLSKKIRPVLIIAIALGIFQQFFGINTVMYYGPIIFQAAGFHGTQVQILATFGMGIVNTIMSAVAVVFIDRVGRRRFLLVGSALAAISLGVVGWAFLNHGSNLSRWAALLAMIVYIAGYCVSVGSLFWLLIAEIFPLSVRGLGMSIATAIQWGANFLVSMTFLTILQHIGPANTFWLYGLMCLFCFAFCYYFVPETKGVSLEQIEQNLNANKPSRELGAPLKRSFIANLLTSN